MNSGGMFILGLTGSIGMGKSTTAGFFTEYGIPVWDADAAVHRLYSKGGEGVQAVAALVPAALVDGAIDRQELKVWLSSVTDGLKKLEKIVHPLVAQDRQEFLNKAQSEGHKMVVVDIPLLFETGADEWCDAVLVVSAPAEQQHKRVLERAGMTKAHFEAILSKQMPDSDKRRKADYVIETVELNIAKEAVLNLIKNLESAASHA